MGGANGWRIETNGSDWMRGMEKRVLHEERRPRVKSVDQLMGLGISQNAVITQNWNIAPAQINGFWYSLVGDTNAPSNGTDYIGESIIAEDGTGIQEAWSIEDPPIYYTRIVHGNGSFGPWIAGGGGGGGGSPVDVSDEGGVVVTDASGLNFVGAGVTAAGAGGGVATITIPGASSGIGVSEEGTVVQAGATKLNFVGGLVTAASDGTGGATVTVATPASSTVDVRDEGVLVKAAVTQIDFMGAGVNAISDGGTGVIVNVTGGGGGGSTTTPDTVSVGVTLPFAGPEVAIPEGYLLCDGSVKNRTAYPELFAVISTNWNTGGETATQFRIPDLRDRTVVGANDDDPLTQAHVLGKTDGLAQGLTRVNQYGHDHIHGATGLGTDTNGSGHTHNIGVADAGNMGGSFSAGGGDHGHSATNMTTTANSRDIADTGSGVSVSTDAHLHTIAAGSGGHSHSGGIAVNNHGHTASSDTTGSGHTHGVTGSVATGGTGRHPFATLNYIIKAIRTNGGTGGTSTGFSGLAPALPAGVWTDIVHGLGTEDVVAAFRDVVSKEGVDIDWKIVDVNTIALRHLNGVAANVIRVVVK